MEVVLRFPETEPLSPPILQLNEVTFYYSPDHVIFSNVNLNATLDSRICIVSIEHYTGSCRYRVINIMILNQKSQKIYGGKRWSFTKNVTKLSKRNCIKPFTWTMRIHSSGYPSL